MLNAKNLSLKNKFMATLGKFLPVERVRDHYELFEVVAIGDDEGNSVGYWMKTPPAVAEFHRYAGFQNSTEPTELTIKLPSQQIIVDGEPHWPFECLRPDYTGVPAFAEVADKIAAEAFKDPSRIRYGVMPGRLELKNGKPIFTVDAEHPEFVLFYANHSLVAFAGKGGYNMVRFGTTDMAMIPFYLAAQLAV